MSVWIWRHSQDTPSMQCKPPSPPRLRACLTGGWHWPQRHSDLKIPKKHFHLSEVFLTCKPRHTTVKAAEKPCPDLEASPFPLPPTHASLVPWPAKRLAEKGGGASWGTPGKALHQSSLLQTQIKGEDVSSNSLREERVNPGGSESHMRTTQVQQQFLFGKYQPKRRLMKEYASSATRKSVVRSTCRANKGCWSFSFRWWLTPWHRSAPLKTAPDWYTA